QKWKNGLWTVAAIAAISLCGIISGSRSGSLLVFLGSALAVSIESWLKIMILGFLGFVLYLITPQLLSSPAIKTSIHDLNERTYDLIYETDATLTTDRSYLTRLAMIEKGLNIFSEYPIAGIGIGNFSNKTFEVDFDFEGAEYIEGKEDQLESKTNPHNSYVSFLSEGGLLLFIPAVFLMFFPIGYFFLNYIKLNGAEKALFIGVIFMCIHAWFIAGMINVYGWFILGITNAVIKSKK
ncbi:MAG: O-antigen ligase family protein, partial [Bacteroidia bacterium]